MLKAILLSIILLCCTGAGRTMCGARRKRYELLGDILAAMRVLRLRMLNSLEPLGVLMRKSDAALFRELGNGLWEGGSLKESWEHMRKEHTKRGSVLSVLSEEDMHILDEFFLHLGGSGRSEQNERFSAVIGSMEEAHKQAKNSYADASKMYTALGTLVGIAVCILIV